MISSENRNSMNRIPNRERAKYKFDRDEMKRDYCQAEGLNVLTRPFILTLNLRTEKKRVNFTMIFSEK